MKIIRIKQRTLYLTACLLLICLVSAGLTVVPRAVDREISVQPARAVTADSGIDLPIIMYHSILKDPARACDYVVSPDTLESDIKYLKEQGYSFILSRDLIDYVFAKGTLPPKPIIITFDDGFYNNYYYAFEILKKYDAKAIISPIGKESLYYSENKNENPNYAYCSWDNLKEMYESGVFEIANHSYNLHDNEARKGCRIKNNEDISVYKNCFVQDCVQAQEALESNVGCEILAYTYPFGAYCRESEEFLQELGYRVTYITENRHNTITRDPDSLFRLARYNRPAGISTEQFMQSVAAD